MTSRRSQRRRRARAETHPGAWFRFMDDLFRHRARNMQMTVQYDPDDPDGHIGYSCSDAGLLLYRAGQLRRQGGLVAPGLPAIDHSRVLVAMAMSAIEDSAPDHPLAGAPIEDYLAAADRVAAVVAEVGEDRVVLITHQAAAAVAVGAAPDMATLVELLQELEAADAVRLVEPELVVMVVPAALCHVYGIEAP
jgi:hypothetical protein